MRMNLVFVMYIAALGNISGTLAQDAATVLKETGITAGFCAIAGYTSGTLASDLTTQGKILVHCVAPDVAALTAIRRDINIRKLYGLASADMVPADITLLPYGQNTVNLLIADLDFLGANAPSANEINRVLAPGGRAYLKTGGSWKASPAKSLPEGYGEWTHYDQGPESNPVAPDMMNSVPTHMQWTNSKKTGMMKREANSMYRLAGGRAFYEHSFDIDGDGPNTKYGGVLHARDAYSGVILWKKPLNSLQGRGRPIIATPTHIYTVLNQKGGYLVALDAGTGELVTPFGGAGAYTQDGPTDGSKPSLPMWAALKSPGLMVVANREKIVAIETSTGLVKWQHTDGAGVYFSYTALAVSENMAFFTYGPRIAHLARSFQVRATGVLCLDLISGAVKWRIPISGGTGIQLISGIAYDRGLLALYHAPEFDDIKVLDGSFYAGAINVVTGKLLWSKDKAWFNSTSGKAADSDKGTSVRAMWVRDGHVYLTNSHVLWDVDGHTGELVKFDKNIGNGNGSRCARSVTTKNFFLVGSVVFVDKNYRCLLQEITRGGNCATAPTPAYGMLYNLPVGCGCFAMIGGDNALCSEAVLSPITDSRRLHTQYPSAVTTADQIAVPANAIADGWLDNDVTPAALTTGTGVNGVTYLSVCNAQRIEARNGSAVLWSFTAGGRISSNPVVKDGLCWFGAHDGYVYCLNAANGAFRWRFLAAPYERRIVAYGQVESSWPVYGVACTGDYIYASAGRHSEIGGGIYLYQLERRTGEMKWKTVVRRDRAWLSSEADRGPTQRCVNVVPSVNGGILSLPGFTLDLGTGAMIMNGAAYHPADYQPPQPVRARVFRSNAALEYKLYSTYFYMPNSAFVNVSLYDVNGKTVQVLFQGIAPAGKTMLKPAYKRLSAGQYYLHLKTKSSGMIKGIFVNGSTR